MLKLNKMTDYAVVCLGMLARKPEYVMSASQISKETGLKLYTVQKILKNILAKSDLLKTELYLGNYYYRFRKISFSFYLILPLQHPCLPDLAQSNLLQL